MDGLDDFFFGAAAPLPAAAPSPSHSGRGDGDGGGGGDGDGGGEGESIGVYLTLQPVGGGGLCLSRPVQRNRPEAAEGSSPTHSS